MTIKPNILPPLTPHRITLHPEASEYSGCSFLQDGKQVVYRTGKTTPRKMGQFVTFWKRNARGVTEPYSHQDNVQFFIIHCCSNTRIGHFILPKATLIQHGILTTTTKAGKRGFRVYPRWDTPTSKQALKTQQWQLDYFVELNTEESDQRVMALLSV